MASLFKLVGSVFVDNEEANKSLGKTEEKANSLGNTFLSGAKTAGKFAAGVATAAAGAVTGLTAMASNAAASMDTIDKASQRMGVSAETYQEFAHVADLCGIEMSTMEKAAKELDEGMSFEDAMAQIYALEDANDRAALATELFGESVAYKMTPMLNATGEEMDAMKQQAYDLGLVFSQDAVNAGADLNDAMNNVKSAITALGTNVGNALMPVVMQACDFITDNLPLIQGMFDKLAPVLIDMFQQLMPQIMDLAQTLLPVLVDLFDTLLPLFTDICDTVLPIIVDLIQTLLPPIVEIVQALLPVLVTLLDALLPILQPLIQLLNPILELLMTLLKPLLDLIDLIIPPLTTLVKAFVQILADKLIPTITKFISSVTDKLVKGFEKISSKFASFRDKITGAVEKIKTKFTTVIDKISTKFTSFKTKFIEIFNAIKEGIKTPINGVIGFINGLVGGVVNGINGMIKAMNKLSFDVPDWVPGIGGKTFGFNLKELTAPQIPLLAEGAVIQPNKPFAAVLGDQKTGTNIEAPLDTIKQAVADVFAELSLAVTVNASPDTAKWFSAMQIEAVKFTRRTGTPSMP